MGKVLKSSIDRDNYPNIILFVLIIMLLFQRISVPYHESQIPTSLFLIYCFLIFSILFNKIKIDILRLTFYIIASGFAICVTLLSKDFSDFSILYFLVIYAPFVFYANISSSSYLKIIKGFQKFMVIVSLIGLIQFLIQFLGISYHDLFSFLPSNFVQHGYNTSYPLVYGSSIYKSNGVIFLEPSFFSQFLAIAFLVEMVYFQRIHRIVLFLAAMFCTFSGTGILLLVITLPFWFKYLLKKKLVIAFTAAILLLIILASIAPADIINSYLSRINEIGTAGTSANMRFIAPYKSMNIILDSKALWLGLGAGAVTGLEEIAQANFPVFPKLAIEYGLFTAILFTLFLLLCFFRRQRNFSLALGGAVMYFILSGSLLQPQIVFFLFILIIFLPLADSPKHYRDNLT